MGKQLVFNGGVTRLWWVPVLTGLLSIVLGVWCLLSPATSLPVLAYTFAVLLCAAGFFNLMFALSNTSRFPGWGWSLAMGILELLCGIWMFSMPVLMVTETFIYVVGFYLVFAVISGIADSCTFYGYSRDWFGWILAILLMALFFAVVFLAGPIGGGIAVWLYLGVSFILFGIYRLIVAVKIRRVNRAIRF